jgi:hypothetical protein
VWSLFFKPRRISVSLHKAHNFPTNGSLVNLFKLFFAIHWTFDAKRVVRNFRDLGGEFYA